MARNLRPVLLNLTAGLAAGLGIAVSFVVELWSQSGSEYLLFSLPAFFFPAATWLRRQRSSLPPLVVLLLVDGWLILVYWWLASAALTDLSNLAAPLAVTAAGSVLALVAARPFQRARPPVRYLATAVFLLVPAGVVAALVPSVTGTMLNQVVTEPAPDAALHLLDGTTSSIRAHRGQVLVLNFWGVWCGPCVRELPEVEATYRRYHASQRATFVAIDSALGGESLAQVGDFIRHHGLTLPVAYETDRGAYKAFRVAALPTTIVIDPQGTVRYRRVGYFATAKYGPWLAGAVEQLIAR